MADLNKMNRTWLCSVLFLDIVKYSSQSVELQMKWKARFNGYLASAIQDVPDDERVILDTGDGAAICFLGAPEAAMFAALEMWHSLLLDERNEQPQLRVRIGINLGPIKLVKDINGALNAIGDGMNAGQRVMSFAAENQILVSQSYFEVVSRLSDDYKPLFTLKGVETDKHVREHTVYKLSPPGAEQNLVPVIAQHAPSGPTAASHQPSQSPEKATPAAPESHMENTARAGSRSIPLLAGGVLFVVVAGAGAWHFLGSAAPPNSSVNTPPLGAGQSAATNQDIAPSASKTASAEKPASPDMPAPVRREPAVTAFSNPPAKAAEAPARVVNAAKEATAPPTPSIPATTQVTADAKEAYDAGMLLMGEDKAAEAARRFDDALRAKPDYIDAYVGRAEARRLLAQYELSVEDCNKVIQLKADDPRGYNCRGFGRQMLRQLDAALPDFNEAIRLSPNFVIAYEHRGTTYSLLQQYDHAIQDYSQALRLAPRKGLFYIRRAGVYSNLKQYDKAIHDYTEAIRLEPDNMNAYRQRALAEEASGDAAGAAGDRGHVKELRKAKVK